MLVGNDSIHESLDAFEIQSDLIRDHKLAALEHLKNRCCPFFLFHSCGYSWEIVM